MAPVLSCYLHLRTKPSFWGTRKQGNPSRSHPSQRCPTADQAATPQPAEFGNLSSSSPQQHKLTIKIHFSKPSGAAFAQSSCRTAMLQGSCSSPMQQHPKRGRGVMFMEDSESRGKTRFVFFFSKALSSAENDVLVLPGKPTCSDKIRPTDQILAKVLLSVGYSPKAETTDSFLS